MSDETPEETPQKNAPEAVRHPTLEIKKKGGWFQKIPSDILISPGGMVIMIVALLIEILGFILPFPILNLIVILPFQIIFYILLITVAKVSIKSLILPSVAEFFFPFLPIWMIKILSSFF